MTNVDPKLVVGAPQEPPKDSKAVTARKKQEEAEARFEAARKLLQEAEAELKADWKPGSPYKLIFDVPVGESGARIKTNGKVIQGRVGLTYEEFQEVTSRMSAREAHEFIQRHGYHEGERYIRLGPAGARSLKLVS